MLRYLTELPAYLDFGSPNLFLSFDRYKDLENDSKFMGVSTASVGFIIGASINFSVEKSALISGMPRA